MYAFDSQQGELLWSEQSAHEGGALAMSMHPGETLFATAGQDGKILIWDLSEAPPMLYRDWQRLGGKPALVA